MEDNRKRKLQQDEFQQGQQRLTPSQKRKKTLQKSADKTATLERQLSAEKQNMKRLKKEEKREKDRLRKAFKRAQQKKQEEQKAKRKIQSKQCWPRTIDQSRQEHFCDLTLAPQAETKEDAAIPSQILEEGRANKVESVDSNIVQDAKQLDYPRTSKSLWDYLIEDNRKRMQQDLFQQRQESLSPQEKRQTALEKSSGKIANFERQLEDDKRKRNRILLRFVTCCTLIHKEYYRRQITIHYISKIFSLNCLL